MSNKYFQISQNDLTIADIESILKENLKLKLDQQTEKKVSSNRLYLDQKLENSDVLHYGINTGFGSLCNKVISSGELRKLQVNLVRSHACGFGKEVDNEMVKIMMLLKIQSLSRGYSGITLTTLKRLIYFFNHDIFPIVYEQGSLGASGDLAPLAHMSLALIGEGFVSYNNKLISAEQIHIDLKIDPILLETKEGLALLNGTQFMSAYAVQAALDVSRLFDHSTKISALSLDAYNCQLSPFNPELHALRPYHGQQYISAEILKLLSESDLVKVKDKDVQDPYSFRCIPQVHGASYDVFIDFKQKVEIEINSVTDNPVIIDDKNQIISGGNFHGQPLAYIMDFLTIAIAELGSISERRVYKLISGTRGLPAFLVQNPGLNSGLMIPQYTAASIVSKNKILCQPASVDSIESSNGQEDHVSMGSISAVKLKEVIENVQRILSIELLVASQAFGFRSTRKTSPSLTNLLENFSNEVPFIEEDTVMHDLMVKSEEFLNRNSI
ncbi:MAG: histidine ammonia-lyase [Bacteroidota bacterium]|nr:histidine ammonia-lyase [Bacteroidota bacterium]